MFVFKHCFVVAKSRATDQKNPMARQYAERRKTELYDELDDEDEDEIILAAS